MNTKELVLRIAARADCTQAQARLVLKALGEELEAALAEGEEVRLAGLGTFSQSWTEPRLVRGIGQGRRRLLDGHYRLRFRPAGALKAAVRSRSESLLKEPAHQDAWRMADTLLADLAAYGPLRSLKLDDADLSDEQVREKLALLAGADWAAAVQTYERRVPADVREACDHLVLAARQRFRS